MSFLISGIDSFILEKSPIITTLGEIWKGDINFSRIGKEEIRKSLQKISGYQNNQPFEIEWSQTKITISLLLMNIFRNFSFVFRLTIDQFSRQLHFTFKLLNDHQSYTVVNSSQRRIFTAKILTFFHRCLPQLFNQYKIYIDTSLGSISIEHPTFINLGSSIDNLGPILTFFIKTFFKGIKGAYEPLLSIIEISNQNLCGYQKDLVSMGGGNRIKKIQKYSKLTSIILNLGTEQTHEETSLKQKMFLEEESLNILNKNFINVDEQFKSRSLFCLRRDTKNIPTDLPENEFELDEKERKDIKSKLQIPQIKAMLENSQRSFIVNHIKLAQKINEQRLKKIATGGFANIYLTEIVYYPISSHTIAKAETTIRCQSKDIRKKPVILKRETINPMKQVRSRLQHEKNILVRVKSALAIFIPKYYFIYNPTQEEKHDLLIQHIYLHNANFSLEDYVKRFKKSLSQQTIVYFAFMITQGLRYLKDYEIVHLDIKQGNIMIGKKLAIKIIDFGESYHPCLKNHRPGVSMPYSPPQSYKMGNFNSKSDVYSFGVLLYYLLTSRYPFYLYEEKERQLVYRQGCISERWFYSPEGLVDYGQTNVFPFLMNLIGKCMEPDPRYRPQLEWISLILRQYLQYFR